MVNDQLSMITPNAAGYLWGVCVCAPTIIRYPGFRPGLSSPGPTARMGNIPMRPVGPDICRGVSHTPHMYPATGWIVRRRWRRLEGVCDTPLHWGNKSTPPECGPD